MKKLLLGVISVMAACSVYGQTVSYRNFNSNQFGSNNFNISIKSSATLSNAILKTPRITGINGTDSILAQTLAGTSGTVLKFTDPNNILWPAVYLSDTGLVAGPIFGSTFTGSGSGLTGIPPVTGILGWPANAAGVLANNGAGVLSWGAGGGGSGITVTNGSGTNLTLYTHDNVPDSTIAPALTIKPLEKPTVPGQGMTAMVIEPPYTNTGYRGRFTLRSTAATNTLGDLRPDITFNLGYNVDGADTNEPLWLDTRESRWQNIPSRSQLEIWHGFSPPINVHGTNDYFRYMGFNLVWDTTNRTYVSSDGNITIDSFYFGVPTVGTNAPGNGLAAFTFAKSRTNSMLLTANQQSQISFNGNTHPDGQAILDKDGGNLAGWYQYGMPAFGVPAAAESNAIVFLPGASLAGGANNTYRWLMGASNVFVGQQWNGPSNRWEYSKNSGGTTIGGLFYRPFNDFSAGWKSVYLSTSLSSTAGDYRELGYVTNHSGGNLSAMVVLTVVGYNNADIARYQVPLTTADGQSASWKECIPITRGLDTASPRIAVDVRGLDFTSALFRLRQLGSTTENNIRVTVELYGSSNGNGSPNGTDWVDTSANTGSGASVASYYRHTPMTQLLNRVGIGTNNPQAALHVIGQAMVSGSVATPKVYTDAIESTNSSSLLMTAGGSSLNLGSSALTLSGAAGGFSGVGANLTALNGTQITTGTIPPARFATNSASSNKWVRATSATTAEWTDLPASGGAVEYSNGQDVTATSGETATSFFYNGDDAMQIIHSSGTTGIILGSEADSMLIQENGKDALYVANGLRHLIAADGQYVSIDYSDPENPIFGTANPRTFDLANIGNGDFLVSVGGVIRGTNSLTVASVNVTGDFNVTGTIYPTNGFTHPNAVGKFFVPSNAPLAGAFPTPTNSATGVAWTHDAGSLSNLNASALASGTVPDARLSSNVPLKNGQNNYSGSNNFSGPLVVDSVSYPPFPANVTNLVIVGDSKDTTFGGGAIAWPNILTNLNFTYRIITNSAVSGFKVSQILANYPTWVAPYAPSAASNAWLISYGGINDIYYGSNAVALLNTQSNLLYNAKSNGFYTIISTLPPASSVTNNLEYQRTLYNSMLLTNRFWDALYDADKHIPHTIPYFTNDMVHYDVAGKTNVALGTLQTFAGGRWNPNAVSAKAFPNVGPHVFSGGQDTFRSLKYNVLMRGSDGFGIWEQNDGTGEGAFRNLGSGFQNFYAVASGDATVDFPADCFLRFDTANARVVTPRQINATNGFAIATVTITTGSGDPESVLAAPVGSLYLRLDGGATTTLYVKTSGTGNTGWTAK